MDWVDIIYFLQSGPSDSAQFFSEVSSHDEIGPTLVAMANTNGGKVFIGIDIKNYHLWGSLIDEQWISTMTKMYCRPAIKTVTRVVEKNDKFIVVIDVVESEKKPCYYKNVSYVMRNKQAETAIPEKNTDSTSVDYTPVIHTEKKEDIASITDELIALSEETTTNTPIHSSTEEVSQVDGRSSVGIPDNIIVNDRQRKAFDTVCKEKSIKNKEYRALFNVSHKTAHIELVDMVGKQLLKSVGAGRSTAYILN